MRKSLELMCACLVLVATALAQTQVTPTSSTTTKIKTADLQADLAILRRAYETLHPGLYRYNTKREMDAAFDALGVQLNHDQSLQDAYLAFSLFAAKIKCGHTYANFFNQPESVVNELFLGQNRVPFYFKWIDGKMIVTRDFTSGHTLPKGTVVLQIGGVPTSTILSRLMLIARADGDNDAKRVALLEVNGTERYDTFDIFFPILFPQPGTTIKLTVQTPGSRERRPLEVEALTYEQRIAPMKAEQEALEGSDGIQFEWKYLQGGIAYLRMPTWALYNSKWDWKSWLSARMDELVQRHSPALIVDLRGNEGGQDVGDVLLGRLVTGELKLQPARRLVRYRQVPSDLLLYLDTWDPTFQDWGTAAEPMKEPWPTAPPVDYYRLWRETDNAAEAIKPEGAHYSGKVFVLVDANNSSATFQFAQTVQQNRLGILVGQPTGGNQRGINGGAFFFLRLPNSKIEMDLPLIGYFPALQMPDAGLTPDILVPRTLGDIVEGRDAALAVVQAQLAH